MTDNPPSSPPSSPRSSPRWWDPDRFARRRPYLQARMAIMRAMRRFFDDRGFAEVETPALQFSPGMEPHLTAFETAIREPLDDSGNEGGQRLLYLHTSPEFAMKKLLVAGEERLYQITHCFRNAERSATHHPEFAMLEWYRARATYRDLMADCEGLLRACLDSLPVGSPGGKGPFRRGDRVCDPNAPWQYISVQEAFGDYAHMDLLGTARDLVDPEVGPLRDEARRVGVRAGEDDTWEDVFFRIFLEKIEPNLGIGAPTVLFDYPISMAALARAKPGDPRVAERFELFVCGLELANGFGELTDAVEQRRRFEADQAKKRVLYGSDYPIDEDFLAALEAGMPDSAGIALGVDRLVMLATGAPSIDDVLWAPVVGPGV